MGAAVVGGSLPRHHSGPHTETVKLCQDIPVRWPEEKGARLFLLCPGRGGGQKRSHRGADQPTANLNSSRLSGTITWNTSSGRGEPADNGADVLDVNVGLPEIDEPSDGGGGKGTSKHYRSSGRRRHSNIEAMERAMRVYNGKPLINSVNGRRRL